MEKTRSDWQLVEHGVRRIHAAYLLGASLGEGGARLFDATFYEEWLDRIQAQCNDIKPEYVDAALAKVWHTVLGIMIRGVEQRRALPHKKSVVRDGGGAIREQLKALEILIFELLASDNDLRINKSEIQIWEERIAIWLDLKPDEVEYAHRFIWETYLEAIRRVGGLEQPFSAQSDEMVRALDEHAPVADVSEPYGPFDDGHAARMRIGAATRN